jgi:methionyl-tRNA synthetase
MTGTAAKIFVIMVWIALSRSFMLTGSKTLLLSGARRWQCRPVQRRISSSLYSSLKPSVYVTTPIYYVNGDPHLGHAYTSAIVDIIARYHRLDNKDVHFLTGTDEHGQKVEQSASKANQSTYAFASGVSNRFMEMTKMLGCTNDDFIRTTEDRHKVAVQELWTRLEKAGHIYLGAYEGWYSVRDEAFYSELELVDGKAPTGANVEWVREESYFFRLSQFTDKLRELYERNPDFIAPRGRRNEVLGFINQEGGLRDLSISRTTFDWGIPVPGNPKHVIYVWLDALTNYLSALGYPNEESALFKKHWPASLHVVGKDILRFHAIYWPAFLLAAGLEPPKVSHLIQSPAN